jgi:YegS/Rv2252/BmrU family lipid kinase
MRPVVAIANAQAGSSETEAVEGVVARLRERTDVELACTEGEDDLREALSTASGRLVVVLGGDGSLHAVVKVLDDLGLLPDVQVALVPMGTGNDFARTVGMRRDHPLEAAEQLLDAEPCDLDLVRDDRGRIVVNAVHVGIGAEAAVEAKPYKEKLGPVGYAIGAVISGVKHKGFRAKVTVDGRQIRRRGRMIQVAVGNGRYIGGGAPLLPEADPGDGLLDVAVSWSNPRLRRIAYAWRLRKGRHPYRDDVEYLRGREVTVVGEETRGNLDGEIDDARSSHGWKVEPGVMTMLLPREPAPAHD